MDSSQAAPLIADRQEDDDLGHDGVGHTTVEQPLKANAGRPGLFVLVVTFCACLSGLLFGYDTGVISATLVSIGQSLSNRDLTSADKSIITSATSLFALLVSPFSSFLADRLGRKNVILYADALFISGAVVQAVSSTVLYMTVGRAIIGMGVGAASFVVPLYIAEVAPAAYRGRLVTTNVVFITLGQVIAYIIGWLFSTYAPHETGWRWMVGLGAVPAATQGVIVLFMPESPRWLVRAGKVDAAERVVRKAHGRSILSASQVNAIVREIELEARVEEDARKSRRGQSAGSGKMLGAWQELLLQGRNRRALAIACLLQGLQQLCGFNSLMYFSATIFTMVGFEHPTLTSLIVAVTNFLVTLVALGLIDRVGRRRILLYSIPFMIVALVMTSFGFSSLSGTVDTAQPISKHKFAAATVLFSIMLYVAAYALGLGNVPWMQSELFPMGVRALGSGVATATNWGANFAVGLTFLPLMEALSPSWTFVLYALVCAAGYLLVWKIYPETAGLSLEEATGLLDSGWGVQ